MALTRVGWTLFCVACMWCYGECLYTYVIMWTRCAYVWDGMMWCEFKWLSVDVNLNLTLGIGKKGVPIVTDWGKTHALYE